MRPRGTFCPSCRRRVYLAQQPDGRRLWITSFPPFMSSPGRPAWTVGCQP